MTPANFYSSSYALFGNMPYLETFESLNIKDLTPKSLSSIWMNICQQYKDITVPVVSKSLNGQIEILGTGQWIDSVHFLTAAHVVTLTSNNINCLVYNQDLIELNLKSAIIDENQDIALFHLPCPIKAKFPKVSKTGEISLQACMIHYLSSDLNAKISVGNSDLNNHHSIMPIFEIAGGKGSSGAAIYNQNGEIVGLHVSKLQLFDNLRTFIKLDKHTLPNLIANANSYPFELFFEEKEHGLFTSIREKRIETDFQLTKNIFFQAKAMVWEILSSKIFDLYTKMWGSSGTIYFAESLDIPLKTLRLDVQNPTTTHINLQIQYKNETLATVLVPKQFSHLQDPTKIVSLIRYTMGQLIHCLHQAIDHGQIIGFKIEPK